MFSYGFIFLWIGYFIIRQTTTPEFKRLEIPSKIARQIMGATFFLIGIRRICLDEDCWSTLAETILFYPIFFIMPIIALIIAFFTDSRNVSDKNILNQKKKPLFFLQFITWDIWIITAIGIFLFFYPLLLIWFS